MHEAQATRGAISITYQWFLALLVSRYCTITSRFIPWWMVQYTWNVPAVLNGPIGALSLPLNCNFTVGAPASWAGFCVLPAQLPLTMMWGDVLSSTRLTASP